MSGADPELSLPDVSRDEFWMRRAIELARRAEQAGEVPIGAVLVREDSVLGEGWNQPIATHDPSAHAEVVALRAAGKAVGNYRLSGTALYVTLEPCIMCIGAMMHGRVERLVFGAADPKIGAAGGAFALLPDSRFNHQIAVQGGVLEQECGDMLRAFFKARR